MALREMLYQGLGRLREILKLPFVVEELVLHKGQVVLDTAGQPIMRKRVDKGLVTEIRQVVTTLADRVHGAIVNRIQVDQRNVSLNMHAGTPQDPLPTVATDHLKAIDAQLAEITGKLAPVAEIQSAADKKLRAQLTAAGVDPQAVITDSGEVFDAIPE
jgi:hypothetical protein